MLLVVLPFFGKDSARMAELLRWAIDLDGTVNFNCLLSYEEGTDANEIRSLARLYFNGIILENEYPKPKSDEWPEAPNWAWTRTALFINSLPDKLPWLWLESDATPLVSGWLNSILSEYVKGGLPFMGHITERESRHPGKRFDQHMNGVAVYPPDACLHSSRAMRTRAAPWDIVLSEDCIGRVHEANHLMWHVPRFTGVVMTCEDRSVIDSMVNIGAVLFHGVNDGSIISLLKGEQPKQPEQGSVVKVLTKSDSNRYFDECESLWQQESVELSKSGFPFVSIEECQTPQPSFQCQTNWRTGIFNELEYSKKCVHLNPGLAVDDDGNTWLFSRRWQMISSKERSCWHSTIQARAITFGDKIKLSNSHVTLDFGTPPMIEHEDPRAIFHDGHFHVSYCTWEREIRQSKGKQGFAKFDKSWKLVSNLFPAYGHNSDKSDIDSGLDEDPVKPRWEKNWVWFQHKGNWHVIYSFSPFRVYRLGRYISEPCGAEPKTWKYGIIRGGTPPVLHDGLYWTFFHSSMPCRRRQKRYYMGAYAFNEMFEIVRMSKAPLLCGSERDLNLIGGPLVIFPGGALIRNGEWFVVSGINDEQCGWIKIPHLDLEKDTPQC